MRSVSMKLKNNKYHIKTIFVLSIVFLLQGCGAKMTAIPVSDADDYDRIFPGLKCGGPLVITGKAKLEFSRYRFRGVFRLEYEEETIRIDFDHSSLFGAVKEEASIFIGQEGITVFDQKRAEYYDEAASGELISGAVGGYVLPSDIFLALLLERPRFSELHSIKGSGDDGRWKISGIYKAKEIEFLGEKSTGPVLLKLRDVDDMWGFSVFYSYSEDDKYCGYPKEITIKTDDGSARITLDIVSVKKKGTK